MQFAVASRRTYAVARALLLRRAHDPHTGRNYLAQSLPTSLWPGCKLRELRKPSSREAEHTRAHGSAPERTARKQTARSLQGPTWRTSRNGRLTADRERGQLGEARRNWNVAVADSVHELRFQQSCALPRRAPVPETPSSL